MKRWVIIITICIILGTIINVAVAWWFAIWGVKISNPAVSYLNGVSYYDYGVWHVDTSIRLGITFSISDIDGRRVIKYERELSAEDALPYWAGLLEPGPDKSNRYSPYLHSALAHGWPFRSMMIIAGPRFDSEDIFLRGLPWDAPNWLRGRPTIPASQTGLVYLPLKIIWPGIIANTSVVGPGIVSANASVSSVA